MIRIVLASASPRRHALLASLGLRFDVITSGAPETATGSPERMVIDNARAKCDDVSARTPAPALVIAADTLVFLDGDALGKPDDVSHARAMLLRLSGRTHQVYTGLAVRDTGQDRAVQAAECTDVTFRPLTTAEIDAFIAAVNPIDRAGAYTVDGPGSLIVARYEGCYQNVLGLPMVRLDNLLRELGYNLFDLMDGSRSVFL